LDSARNIIVVTGGTSGIGKAVVDAVLTRGWIPVVLDVNVSALAQGRAA
jgi:NAD(P)-dependent dehydrogenase (short-subunit alcohol dehydrogenase family)